MKAYLINMHLVPRSRSSAKVMVKYKGYISQKMAVSGAFAFLKHILFMNVFLLFSPRKAAKKEEERLKKLKQKTEIDSYAECYPG